MWATEELKFCTDICYDEVKKYFKDKHTTKCFTCWKNKEFIKTLKVEINNTKWALKEIDNYVSAQKNNLPVSEAFRLSYENQANNMYLSLLEAKVRELNFKKIKRGK